MTTNEDNQTKDKLLANLRERKQKVEDGRKGERGKTEKAR